MTAGAIARTRRLPMRAVLLGCALAGALAWVIVDSRPAQPLRHANGPADRMPIGGHTMGGTWSIKAHGLRGHAATTVHQGVQRRLDQVEDGMSTYRPDSWVCRFNAHRGTDWFPVPVELAEIVGVARQVSEQTGGAFDVTVAPLTDLWGFGSAESGLRKGQVPADAAIAHALKHVDYRRLHARLSPPALRKDHPDLRIDLSGIAKGYAAGELARALRDDFGVPGALVAVGGELRSIGPTIEGRAWPVGVEVPTPDTRRVLRTLELRDAGLSTSGDYRHFTEIAGRRYGHVIDPRTGRPLTGDLASVSVVHPDSAYADAMATGLLVLGPEDGWAVARRLRLAVLFVLRGQDRFETRATPEFERNVPAHGDADSRGLGTAATGAVGGTADRALRRTSPGH